MVFTHACVAHQSFQEPEKLIKSNKSIREISKHATVDISYQGHKNIPDSVIRNRSKIVELVADGNFFNENVFNMPLFPKLKILSIKSNRIRNIGTLLTHLRKTCPNLEVLNIEENPGWPAKTDVQNLHMYRKTVISFMKSLLVLNGMDTHRRKMSTLSISSITDSESSADSS